jgi:hypothetical protein
MDLKETEVRYYCAGEGQQQFNRPTDQKAEAVQVGPTIDAPWQLY